MLSSSSIQSSNASMYLRKESSGWPYSQHGSSIIVTVMVIVMVIVIGRKILITVTC